MSAGFELKDRWLHRGSAASPQVPLLEPSIPDRLEHIVRCHPHRLALKVGERAFTYDELNRAANRFAHAILAQHGRQTDPIALLFENGFEGIAAFFGVLKAGRFAVTLAPSFPLERLTQILDDSQARLIVTDAGHVELAGKFQHTHAVLNIDETDPAFCNNPGLHVSANDLAALMYTSGSTGTPKGVIRAHRTLLQLCGTYADKQRVTVNDRLSLVHSLSFGSAYSDLVPALLHGALLLPFDLKAESMHRFAAWLDEEQITICHLPPLAFRQLAACLTSQKPLPHLRLLCLSGSSVTRADFELYAKHFASSTLLQIRMGSTEAGVVASAIVDRDFAFPQEGTPIGYPHTGRTVLLLDEHHREVAPGEVGEIAVKGRDMSLGYWRRPDLTGKKFLAARVGDDERTYLTGDLGRRLPDGMVVHLGRKDSLVKIRGYRIEIAEIEGALQAHPDVREAAVVAWDRAPGDKYLAAYVVPQPGCSRLGVSALHNWLKGTLPDYMLPASFMFLTSLPVANGKVNRQALPLPGGDRPALSSPYVGPRNSLESQLVKLWENLLGTAPIGVDDDFFALGGYSLLGAALMAQVHDTLETDLRLRALFEAPTIAQLARCIEKKRAGKTYRGPHTRQASYLFELQAGGDRPPVFFFPGGGGGEPEFFVYARLARSVGAECPFYGLRARGADGVSSPHRSVATMATDYLADMKTLQPHGPYFLVGECFGGIVAYEVACQLQAKGEPVAALILMDTQRPTDRTYWRYRAKHSLGPLGESLFNGRLGFHWEVLRNLPYAKRISYTAGYAVKATRWCLSSVSRVSESARRARAVVESNTTERYQQHIMEARHRYRLTLRRHRPQPYNGPIDLLVNEHYHQQDPALGWDRLAQGRLNIHKMPGNHDTYIREHVQVTATTLRACLDDASTGSSQPPLQSAGHLLTVGETLDRD